MRGVSRHSFITMEGSEHISVGDAEVGAPFRDTYHDLPRLLITDTISQILLLGTFETANADDTE